MEYRDIRRYDAFKRVETFGEDHAADFAPDSVAAKKFAALSQIITQLDTAAAGQKPGRPSKATLLDAIRLDLHNLTRTAGVIDQEEPGFANLFPPPANTNERALLAAADKILAQLAVNPADDAAAQAAKAALAAKFQAHEMSANFVANLQADCQAIADTNKQREKDREGGVGNTALISQLIAEGMKTLAALDAIMHNKYGSAPDKMAAWQTASHIERSAQRSQPPPAPPAPPAKTP